MITGQKQKLVDITNENEITIEITGIIKSSLDMACFGLDESRKLCDDRYMVFFNQRKSPEGSIDMMDSTTNGKETFKINFSKLPNKIKYLVFTVSIDGNETMKSLSTLKLNIIANNKNVCEYTVTGSEFKDEKAITLFEIYFKDVWRVSAVGKGFNGGLDALLIDFGGEIDYSDTVQNTKQPQTDSKRVSLEKRIEKEAPKLVSLVKSAKVSLEKAGLSEHRAKVALCLDISASMTSFYKSGKIQDFAERILALATRFDDDGEIDVFVFGANASFYGTCNISNISGYVDRIIREKPYEYGTVYHLAIDTVRSHYFEYLSKNKEKINADIPVYVMFLTDGDTSNKGKCELSIKNSSFEPIFWSFMGIGKEQFGFLTKLDELRGRLIDNAGLITVKGPTELPDEVLYSELVKEYKNWVPQAKSNGLIN